MSWMVKATADDSYSVLDDELTDREAWLAEKWMAEQAARLRDRADFDLERTALLQENEELRCKLAGCEYLIAHLRGD